MKKSFLFVGLLILLSISTNSCSTEEDLDFIIRQVEDNNDDPTSDDPGDTDPTPDPDPDPEPDDNGEPVGTLAINETACDYGAELFSEGITYTIGCTLDLNNQTVDLPNGIILEYDGGQIINGTLNFSGSGKIDGKLLNKDLELTGNASLIETTFDLFPERWELVQGTTTSDLALQNNTNLENLFEYTKSLGATTFRIDEFDAYFEITKVTSTTTNQNFYPSLEAINIPSDFNLVMTNNTHLRTFPNNAGSGVLLGFREVSNSSVTGGILYGDRDEHDYSGESPGEGGTHLMVVRGANNIVIDGVTLKNGSKGGLYMNAVGFTFNPDYVPSTDITIKNCLFDSNRRMSLALTDGDNVLIENNRFINTANETANSDGGVVGFAINLEGVRKRNDNGDLVFYERVRNITLRGNTERGSRVGGFNIFTGENIVIENNDIETNVSWSFASDSKVRYNKFTASNDPERPAILAGGEGETVFNNEIYGNEIKGYNLGITAYHGKLKIYDNDFEEVKTGITLFDVTDVDITENRFNSTITNSRGIYFQITQADDVMISGNEINVEGNHIRIIDLNQQPENANNQVIIENNKLISSAIVQLSKTSGVIFRGNESSGRIQMSGSSNVEISNNLIDSTDGHGIAISTINEDISITNNTISYPSNFNCINIKDTTNPNEVNMTGNQCN